MTDATAGRPAHDTDEKLCPYCAETIKAAAVRCRWCRSDLPPRPEETVQSEPAPSEQLGQPPVTWAMWLLTGTLAFALVLAGTVLVRQLLAQDDWSRVPDGNTPLAAGAQVQSEEAKRAAMVAATSATERILSYDAKTLDDDVAAVQGLLGGEMLEQYAETMGTIRAKTVENEAVVEASVVSASAISATEHDAKVLLFVNQTTNGKHLDQPRADLNRVVVTMHRDDGDWTVTELDAL